MVHPESKYGGEVVLASLRGFQKALKFKELLFIGG
jgi:hypothetical protein